MRSCLLGDKILNSYSLRIKTKRSDIEGKISFAGNTYGINSYEFTEITIPYTDVQVSVSVFEVVTGETVSGMDFDIRCQGDIFWMILSLTSRGYFEFESNEPLQIIKNTFEIENCSKKDIEI